MAGKRVLRAPSAPAARRPSTRASSRAGPRRASNSAPSDDDDSFSEPDHAAADDDDHDPDHDVPRGNKRRKVAAAAVGTRPRQKTSRAPAVPVVSLFHDDTPVVPTPCSPSAGRPHALAYHKPLFLSASEGRTHRRALLAWFDSVSATRAMPWRQPWLDPRAAAPNDDAAALRGRLERRAYQVWISEIMLQQTRVAVVIDYWNRWMARWPTIQDLAAAQPEDVLAAWRGLGYYSRATRIHEAARKVVQDAAMQGLLPSTTHELQAQVPGVGRYTAGAIAAIVFGRPAPMVDGNVLRVLSRQLGIHANVKTDRRVVDTIWAAADALVKAVALLDGDRPEDDGQRLTTTATTDEDVSDRPGRWGQALMELGSTVCTPKPNCAQCPVTASCRVYAEAEALVRPSSGTGAVPRDIEDACTLCEPFDEPVEHDPALAAPQQSSSTAAAAKSRHAHPAKPVKAAAATRQRTLADFAFTGSSSSSSSSPKPSPPPLPPKQRLQQDAQIADAIASYARRFPLKTVKKALRAEQVLVCAIRRPNGTYLIRRRPDKGLLAGLWEFPSKPLPPPPPPPPQQPQEQEDGEHQPLTSKQRINLATEFAAGLFERTGGPRGRPRVRHVADLGSVPWVFSHLKLTMHVHLFALLDNDGDGEQDEKEEEECTLRCGDDARWTADVEGESMGTGMRKCWALVRDAETW